MKFFGRTIIKSATKISERVGIFRATTNTKVPSDGRITMWGTPGNSRASIVQHDTASKVQAEIDAARIKAAGKIPKTAVSSTTDSSRYGSDGIISVKYRWDTSEENPRDTTTPRF